MASNGGGNINEFQVTYYWAGEQRTVGVCIPRWVILWVIITLANAVGFTEPAKMVARHLFGLAGCG
jgi:hypothetical protein